MGILAVQRQPGVLSGFGIQTQIVKYRRHDCWQAQVRRQIFGTDCMQGICGNGDNFGIRLCLIRPIYFTTRLGHLAFRAQLRSAHAQHWPGITQAQRAGGLDQAGCGDACDLNRHIGAHPHHALGYRVHQAECMGGRGRSSAIQQAVFKFHQGRVDPTIGGCPKAINQTAHNRRLACCLWGQNIAQAIGKQRLGRAVSHCSNMYHWEFLETGTVVAGLSPLGKRNPRISKPVAWLTLSRLS